MTIEKMIEILNEMNVISRDNGRVFTDLSRLNVIEEKLQNSSYICTKGDLCRIYSKKPLDRIKNALVVTSHVDCERHITECFSQQAEGDMLKGTYDNSITNTAILILMMENRLPDNVIVSFTGDEEIMARGAAETCHILWDKEIEFRAIVLDVTNEGWQEKADVSLENDFFDEESRWGKKAVNSLVKNTPKWCFVPIDSDDVPVFVPEENLSDNEAEPDESWALDEMDIECFSLCIPVYGEMHSDEGVLCRKNSFSEYVHSLEMICSL